MKKSHRNAPLETALMAASTFVEYEADKIKELGGIIVEIDNPSIENTDTHISENTVLPYDYKIYNSGSLTDLHDAAFRFVHYTLKGNKG